MAGDFEFSEKDILPISYYEQEVHALARDLLGRVLVRQLDDDVLMAGRIVEVELYGGVGDLASHGRTGKPGKRTWPMFERAGTSYIYKIYGMYDCLNIAAGEVGEPWAVLIRAVEPLAGIGEMAVRRKVVESADEGVSAAGMKKIGSGPGKMCMAMEIDKRINGILMDVPQLCVVAGEPVGAGEILESARIGLNPKTCGDATYWPWRYTVAGSRFLSR